MASRGVLSRKEIGMECGFTQSALSQNPRIRAALKAKEDELRAAGLLPSLVTGTATAKNDLPLREAGRSHTSMDVERLKRLELDNAALRAENEELKRKLERYALVEEALATTGRLLR